MRSRLVDFATAISKELGGRPLDPLVIMVIIEPTKDQQAAFEAEDAAREDLTGE